MSPESARRLLVRNFVFWMVAAVLYPIAHWIPTGSGMPPKIYEVLVPVMVFGLGLASNAMWGAAIKKG